MRVCQNQLPWSRCVQENVRALRPSRWKPQHVCRRKREQSKSVDVRLGVGMIKPKHGVRQGLTVMKARRWNGSWMVLWGEADPVTENILHDYTRVKKEKGEVLQLKTELTSLFACNDAWNQNVTDTIRNLIHFPSLNMSFLPFFFFLKQCNWWMENKIVRFSLCQQSML